MTEVLRMTAFPAHPDGGNPAGVVLDAGGLSEAEMLRIAGEVGYAETAFVLGCEAPEAGAIAESPILVDIRYFSPRAEVPFCGHATVATAAVLAEKFGQGEYLFRTPAGDVVLETSSSSGTTMVSFASVEPSVRPLDDAVLDELLSLLGLTRDDLDTRFAVRESFAGNWHPMIVLHDREVFNQFRFDPRPVADLMQRNGWTGTITVLHELGEREFSARNLFPVGRITEDPATGSAAASTGAYLRALAYAEPEFEIVIHQGAHVGRPSVLHVRVPKTGGIVVTGTATRIEHAP